MRFSKTIFTSFTVTTASPAVFTATKHELAPGDELRLETTGALPTGLTKSTASSETIYYVLKNGYTDDEFQVGESRNGDAIATTADGSGDHTFLKFNKARLTVDNVDNK